MIDAIEGIEGLPPALLLDQLLTPVPQQPVAGPAVPQVVAQGGAIAAVIGVDRRQQHQGPLQVPLLEQAQGPGFQLAMPLDQLLLVRRLAGSRIDQLQLQFHRR